MGRAKTPSFVTELLLKTCSAQERIFLARLEAGRQVYNACLGESLKRLRLLRQSQLYQAARKLPKGPKGSAKAKARARAFHKANAAVGFREYDLHDYAAQFNRCWLGQHLDINTIQKLATRAFKATQQYAFGKRGRPRFKGKNQMDSLEGKTNKAGIRWRTDHIEWLDLNIEAIIDADDPVIAHGLSSHIKFVRIVRRKHKGRNRFYVQLVCEGKACTKPKHKVGQGLVGLDIGPSTIAAVGAQQAFLKQFCDELNPSRKEIRCLQRKLDRQRRANNPDNYLPDGRIRPGPKQWYKSARQRETEIKLTELQRKQAAHRKSLHGQLVNTILSMGNVIQTEKLSYRAFQRCFGRSVGLRAPGKFVEHLKRKAESASATVLEFPTHSTRLSQVCHNCGTLARKPLSQRWHRCECGIEAQRDLYSAFLASCVEGDWLNAGLARMRWPGADPLLQAALSQACQASQSQPAKGRRLPSSFGLSGQRQSWSPVASNPNAVETQDVVPPVAPRDGRESL